jgi:hypothetical protein
MLLESHLETGPGLLLLALGLGASAALLHVLRSVFLTRFEILPEGIRCTRAWGPVVELRFDDIAGYRVPATRRSRGLLLVPKDTPLRPISIDSSLERRGELMHWVRTKFRGLDHEEHKAELDDIMADERFGRTAGERAAALERARTLVRVLNGASYGLLLWAIIYPRPYDAVIISAAILPVVMLGAARWSRGLIIVDGTKTSVRPVAGNAIITPCLLLALRALADWHILEWSHFWSPFTVLVGALWVLGWQYLPPMERRKPATLFILGVLALAYAYGLVLYLNCSFDHADPVRQAAIVQSRRVSSGRTTTYYLSVSPWLGLRETKEISVSRATYQRHPEGSPVQIGLLPGALSIPWFWLQ